MPDLFIPSDDSIPWPLLTDEDVERHFNNDILHLRTQLTHLWYEARYKSIQGFIVILYNEIEEEECAILEFIDLDDEGALQALFNKPNGEADKQLVIDLVKEGQLVVLGVASGRTIPVYHEFLNNIN